MRAIHLIVLVVAWVCGACAEKADGDWSRENAPENTPPTASVPPPGAIRVGDDYYMVPIATDDSGCLQYRGWSSSRPVPAAIYYRKPDGEFTLYRSDTGCGNDAAR